MSYDPRRVAESFSNHPLSELWEGHVREIRKAGHQLAEEILHRTPPCPEQTLAINKVREAVMYASSGMALHQG